MAKEARRMINLPESVFSKLEYARGAVDMATGKTVPNTRIIEMALDLLLSDALPPALAEERHRMAVTHILGQVVAQLRPDLRFKGIAVNESTGDALLDFGDDWETVIGCGPISLAAAEESAAKFSRN